MTLREYIKNNFERVYYINLDSRTDRRDRCIEIFKQYNILDIVCRVSGVAPTIDDIKDDIYIPTNKKIPINKILGRIGCTTSHLKVMQMAKHDKIERILIFEDDIEFYSGKEDTVHDYEQILYDANKTLQTVKWDLHYLGYYPCPNKGLYSQPSVVGPNIFIGKFLQSAHAIGYSKRAYNKVLEDLGTSPTSLKWKELGGTIDEYLGFVLQNNSKFITTAIAPILCYQRPGRSDIQDCEKSYGAAYIKNNIIMLRDKVPDNFIRFPVKEKHGKFYEMNKNTKWDQISTYKYEKYTTDTF